VLPLDFLGDMVGGVGLLDRQKRHELGVLVEEHPALEEVGQRVLDLILGELGGRDREDVVEFLQSTLLGFWVVKNTVSGSGPSWNQV